MDQTKTNHETTALNLVMPAVECSCGHVHGQVQLDLDRPQVLTVEDVSFSYGEGLILDHLSFELFEGDFAMLKGVNGSGKSTLMKLILHELKLQSGQIALFGEPLAQVKDWTRMAYLEQNAIERNQHFPATAKELLSSYLYARRKREHLRREDERRIIDEALQAVEMADYKNRLIGRLSGGQQQRILLAALLAADVRFLCLDEPTAGMDVHSSRRLYELLSRLQVERKLTILMISHDLEELHERANRVFCLEHGNLVELSPEQRALERAHQHLHHYS